jgi:ATP-dependent Clp protease ATP-binding subunit ClpB
MTSNMGSHLIQEKFENIKESIDSSMELTKQEVIGLLKQTMRPEFINRIDDIILFTPLSKDTIKSVVSLQIENVKKMLLNQEITLDATTEAIDYLTLKGYQPEYGARPVKRVIQKEVLNQLSKEMLAGKINADSIILLDCFDDRLVFRNQLNILDDSKMN